MVILDSGFKVGESESSAFGISSARDFSSLAFAISKNYFLVVVKGLWFESIDSISSGMFQLNASWNGMILQSCSRLAGLIDVFKFWTI
jgi:hypothetical protein